MDNEETRFERFLINESFTLNKPGILDQDSGDQHSLFIVPENVLSIGIDDRSCLEGTFWKLWSEMQGQFPQLHQMAAAASSCFRVCLVDEIKHHL